jgi:hypothetical protein
MLVKTLSLTFGKRDANLLGSRHNPGPIPLGLRTRSGIGREIRQAVGGVLVFSTFVVYNSNSIYKMLGTEI